MLWVRMVLAILGTGTFSAQGLASDPVLDWVNRVSPSSHGSSTDGFNPGFLALDETEIRVDFSERFQSEKQSVRLSLKPLLGLNNEYKLSRQRDNVLKAKNQNYKTMNRLQAYSQILRAWSVLKAERLVERSAKVFQWVQANLKPQLTNQTIQSDPTKLVVSLADFMNTKTKLGHLRAHYVGVFKSEYASKELLRSIEQLKLLDMRQIEEKLKSDQSLAVPLVEEQEKKLKFFQLQQKKKEAYQIVKFISVEREERRNNGVGYSSQVSFRVPFLSDSEELRRAKADFASANSDFELSKLKEKRELLELKSETLGLIEKYKILTMLPKTSFSMKKIKNKIASVPEVARGEAEYLDAQIDLIETRSLIFQHYLLYLAKSRQLGSKSVNYLTQRIPNR